MQVFLGSTRAPEFLRKMKAMGWGRLFSQEEAKPLKGEPWALDNGVFAAHNKGLEWNEQRFLRNVFISSNIPVGRRGGPLGENGPWFAALPDKVADPSSLAFSVDWYNRVGIHFDLPWFLVLQDGMRRRDVRSLLRQGIEGLLLGGSDEFKLEAERWCDLAHEEGAGFHYARASSLVRLEEAHRIGADSVDTTQPLWSEEAFDKFAEVYRRLTW